MVWLWVGAKMFIEVQLNLRKAPSPLIFFPPSIYIYIYIYNIYIYILEASWLKYQMVLYFQKS